MIYEFKCTDCDVHSDVTMSVAEYDIKRKLLKCDCGGEMVQVYSIARPVIRTEFPRNFVSEHVAPDPVKIRDESHYRDVAAKNDLVVTNPWDGM